MDRLRNPRTHPGLKEKVSPEVYEARCDAYDLECFQLDVDHSEYEGGEPDPSPRELDRAYWPR